MRRAILAATVLIVFVGSVQAGNTYYNAGTGNWSTGSNWDNGEPGSGDYAYINNGGTAQITPSNDESCNSLYLGEGLGDIGTVDMTGGSLTVSHGLTVGGYGAGVLDVTAGVVSNEWSYVGYYSGSTGTVMVDGAGSTWINWHGLSVGKYGSGTLNITGGGAVRTYDGGYIGHMPGSTGAVTVEGTGSTWTNSSGTLYVGYGGNGTLDITGGGAVSSSSVYIGHAPGSTGAVTVEGTGSTWTNSSGTLYVGHVGNGTLDITGGSTVINRDGHIGFGSTGEVTVDGPGSTWTNSSDLTVGYFGSGTLNITGGGTVTAQDETWVSRVSGSSGTIHFDNGTLTTGGLFCGPNDLTGTGTINTNGLVSDVDLVFDSTHGLSQTFTIDDNPAQSITVNLDIDGSAAMGAGLSGAGTMTISDGIGVDSTDGYIGYKSGSTGVVTVDGAGSRWTNDFFSVGRFGDGTLNITAGGAVRTDSGYIGHFSGSTGAVTVDGSGSSWINSHGLSVGKDGSGTLNITGGGVRSRYGYIGFDSGSTGVVTVDGSGSTWTNNSFLAVGASGSGTLNITAGGAVSNVEGYIGDDAGSTGEVSVDGSGSTWTNSGDLFVGDDGAGTLNITDGGLVSVAGALTIDWDEDGDGFINMATNGMLALWGDADDSLAEFLGLISGTDAIRYWHDDISDWDDITNATMGVDYSLSYLTAGDLAGYTMLTVPEPATMSLLALGACLPVFRRKKWQGLPMLRRRKS